MFEQFDPASMHSAAFMADEVTHHVMYRIAQGERAISLQAAGGDAIALQSPGRPMWFWLNPGMGEAQANAVISALVGAAGYSLPGCSAVPQHAAAFADAYCTATGAVRKGHTQLIAYRCPQVNPVQVPGGPLQATVQDRETIARFYGGFLRDIGQADLPREQLLDAADGIIRAGNLRFWQASGELVCMAGVMHRTARHARVGMVYTPPEHRSHGYASALVASVSAGILGEGLQPMLYADAANPISNKVYRNIGYIEAGRIDEIVFDHASRTE